MLESDYRRNLKEIADNKKSTTEQADGEQPAEVATLPKMLGGNPRAALGRRCRRHAA